VCILLGIVDDISISRIVVIVKYFDVYCCLTRLFNRSERELRSCEREGHPSFTSSDQALQACLSLYRFAGMTNRFHDWSKGIRVYRLFSILPVFSCSCLNESQHVGACESVEIQSSPVQRLFSFSIIFVDCRHRWTKKVTK
jgi:hypothetical protein